MVLPIGSRNYEPVKLHIKNNRNIRCICIYGVDASPEMIQLYILGQPVTCMPVLFDTKNTYIPYSSRDCKRPHTTERNQYIFPGKNKGCYPVPFITQPGIKKYFLKIQTIAVFEFPVCSYSTVTQQNLKI